MSRYTRKKSLRLQNYDYAKNGLYFITICTKNSQHLFGTVENGEMNLNSAGEMVKRIWSEIPLFYKGFVLHDFIVMPNHFHGVIEIVIVDEQRTTTGGLSLQKQLTIPEIVHRFKTLTTRKYMMGFMRIVGKVLMVNCGNVVIMNILYVVMCHITKLLNMSNRILSYAMERRLLLYIISNLVGTTPPCLSDVDY